MATIKLGQPIQLNKKETLTDKLVKLREKDTLLGKITKTATSLKTTAVLGTVLAGLVTAGGAGAGAAAVSRSAIKSTAKAGAKVIGKAVTNPKTLITAPLVAGVLSQSETARGVLKNIFNPKKNLERGETIGKIIDDPSQASNILGLDKEKSTKDKIVQGVKTAGVVGGVIGAGVLAKKAIDKVRAGKEEIPTLGVETTPRPAQVGVSSLVAPAQIQSGSPVGVSSQAQPIQSSNRPLTIVQIDL